MQPTHHCYFSKVAIFHLALLLATLVNLLLGIGVQALLDTEYISRLATVNPFPILLQDGLKLGLAVTMSILTMKWHPLLCHARRTLIRGALIANGVSIGALICNATASLYLLFEMNRRSHWDVEVWKAGVIVINLFGILSLISGGVWFLIVNLTAMRFELLKPWVWRVGIGVGVCSLLPPLAILVLVLSLFWTAGLLDRRKHTSQ